MKTKIIIIFFIIFGIFNNAFSIVVYIYSDAIPITTDTYCGTTKAVKIKWRANQWNNKYFTVIRTTDPNWNWWYTVSPRFDGCGTCSARSFEFIDYGPFDEGVYYYYKIEAVSNSPNYTRHEPDGSPILFPVQPCKDWKKQTTDNILIGETSPDRNAYTWHEENNIIQGVRLNLILPEKVPIYLQQNNNIINFETNSLSSITHIEVNINDQGWQELYNSEATDQFLWQNSSVYFNSIGHYNLKVKYMIASSSTMYNREYDIYVILASQKLFKDNYCNTLRCWKGNSSNGIPVVFSEGFDAYDCTTQEFYYWVAQDIFSCLQANGYDVYLLDNKFGTQDIRNNAAGFDATVRYVSSINNNQQVIAGGASMGGMIARYAFAKAEQDGVPLPASKFVSIDSPQQGAVISKSLQDYKKSKQQGDPFAQHALNNDAAKELLNYNTYDPNSGYSNSIHKLFYNELNSLNGDGYPHLTENIGISFSNNTPNPNSGVWIKIECADWYGNCPSFFEQEFTLESDEVGAGSYLPADLTMMSPVIMRIVDWGWTGFLGTLWAYPWVSVNRTKDPCYIPYNSALDIVNGQSKFDVTIIPDHTTYHDVVPPEIIDSIVNAVMHGSTKYLQNKTETGTITYNNYNKIIAGNHVTNKIPAGDYIIQNGANVTFIAGEEIDLEPGFEVKEGAIFEAGIQPIDVVHCNSSKMEYESDNNADNQINNSNPEDIFNFSCNPNPFSENTTIILTIDKTSISKVYIVNLLGTKIKDIYSGTMESGQYNFVVNLKSYPSGMYYCIFETNEGYIKTIKILKQ